VTNLLIFQMKMINEKFLHIKQQGIEQSYSKCNTITRLQLYIWFAYIDNCNEN